MSEHKIIINLCPTGMVPTKAMTPHVPVTNKEIAAQINECAELGVNMAHIHVRDKDEEPHYSKDLYGELIGQIRALQPDMTICVSCSGRNFSEFEKRSEVLELKGDLRPDMASLTLTSLNFARQASVNSPDTVRMLAEKMGENDIKPELEVFDLGMMNYANYLISKGIIKPPYYFNIILGNIATAQATPAHLAAIIAEMPPESYWSVGGIGGEQLKSCMMGILHGNGVRIGLEDNIFATQDRSELATNRGLVEQVRELAKPFEKKPFSQLEVRTLLGIAPYAARQKVAAR